MTAYVTCPVYQLQDKEGLLDPLLDRCCPHLTGTPHLNYGVFVHRPPPKVKATSLSLAPGDSHDTKRVSLSMLHNPSIILTPPLLSEYVNLVCKRNCGRSLTMGLLNPPSQASHISRAIFLSSGN